MYEVEKESFRELVKVLDPRYVMPSRKHFSQVELPRLYDACRAKVEREVCSVGHFALTTDLWTSRVTQPYMSVTIHFISEDWTLCARCLQTAYFPDDHTGAMLAQGLRDALESWGLQECHLVCVTTDNATNNITAMELNEWQRLQCFGHRLQLAIENTLKALTPASTKQAVERAVGVCKKVVSAFSNSWKRKRDLAKAQAVLGLPPHQLITETPTRWGSRQQMIQRFLEQEKALSQVLLADKKVRHGNWTLHTDSLDSDYVCSLDLPPDESNPFPLLSDLGKKSGAKLARYDGTRVHEQGTGSTVPVY
ncbi:zinc finger BED domain-containing protein 4-like isoform 1-T1 [Fundulus diaphanus]